MNNVINWFDVPTRDFDRAVRFYSAILGADVKIMDMMGQSLGFFPMEGREGVGGDIVPPRDDYQPSAHGTRVYLNCEGRLDEVLGRVVAAGGKIVTPKFSLGDPGWIALIEDTEGNIIGLHNSK